MPAFLHKSYWCDTCNKGYNSNRDHRCSLICQSCFRRNACPLQQIEHCKVCNRWFQSRQCFDNHREAPVVRGGVKRQKLALSICQRVQRCKIGCGKLVDRDDVKNHKCGHYECQICREYVKREGKSRFFLYIVNEKKKITTYFMHTFQDIYATFNRLVMVATTSTPMAMIMTNHLVQCKTTIS